MKVKSPDCKVHTTVFPLHIFRMLSITLFYGYKECTATMPLHESSTEAEGNRSVPLGTVFWKLYSHSINRGKVIMESITLLLV